MGELVDRDQEHLRLLKVGYYVMAGTTGFMSLFALMFIGLGALFASGAVPTRQGSSDDPRVAGLFLLAMGAGLLVFGLATAFLIYYAGRGIAERRHRVLAIIVAAMSCLQFPWGSVLGVCAIIVLSRPSVKALFERPGTAGPA